MNEVAEPIILSGAELLSIPIDQLFESPLNPRKYFAEGPLGELEESIRKSGIRTPLILWPRVDAAGYWIAAGHRRFRAAKRAGLQVVPALVREMSESEFLEVLTFENSQREDVHPLEEAAGFRTYMDQALADVPDVAAKVGKSTSYVYQRLKLLDLTDESQRALWDNTITAGHAILIARLQPKDQARVVQACEPPQWNLEKTVSVRDLQVWIKRNLHCSLEDAEFDCESADLVPAAGACGVCPHRLGNMADFNPLEDIADTCTRPDCYHQKSDAHEALLEAEEARNAPPVPEPVRWAEAPAPSPQAPKAAKPSKEEKAREAERVRLANEERKREEERQQRAREEAEKKLESEKGVRTQILRAILDRVQWPPRREEIIALLNDVVPELPNEIDDVVREQGIEPGKRFVELHKLADVKIARLAVISCVAGDMEEWNLGRGMDKLNSAAKRYGVDPLKIRAAAEGGTRKQVVAKLPTLNEGAKKAAPVDPKAAARLAVECPQCHATPGERCRNYKGDFCHPHGVRKRPVAKVVPAEKAAPKKQLTESIRKRIAAAQKKRWAEHKKRWAEHKKQQAGKK